MHILKRCMNPRWLGALVVLLALLAGTCGPDGRGNGSRVAARPARPARPAAPQQTLDQAREALSKLPLTFEANQGQAARPVHFVARGRGYNLFVLRTGA